MKITIGHEASDGLIIVGKGPKTRKRGNMTIDIRRVALTACIATWATSSLTFGPVSQPAATAPTAPILPNAFSSSLSPSPVIANITSRSSEPFDLTFIKDTDLGQGRHQTVLSSQPVNYRSADGSWQPIDLHFEVRPSGFANAHNRLQINASDRHGTLKLRSDGDLLGWEPLQVMLDGATQITLATPLDDAQALTGTLRDDAHTIHYAHGWSMDGLGEEVTAAPGAAEHSLIFAQRPNVVAPSPRTLQLHARLHLLPGYAIRGNGLFQTTTFTTAQALEIVNPKGQVAFVLPPARAFEQAHPETSVAASYRLTPEQGGTWQVLVETPWRWWQDSARRYPVVLDPIIQVQRPFTAVQIAADQNCIRAFGPADGSVGVGRFRAAGGIFGTGLCETPVRTLIRYDNLPALKLPTGAAIQKAEWLAVPTDGFIPHWNGIAFPAGVSAQVFAVSSAWAANTVAWANQPATEANPRDTGRLFFLPSSGQQLYNGTNFVLQNGVTGMVTDWLNGINNNGLELRAIPNQEVGCDNGWNCHFVAIPPVNAWEGVRKNFENAIVNEHGGFMLAITYQAPTLTSGQPYGYDARIPPPTAETDPYYRTAHAYALPTFADSEWMAVGVKGFKNKTTDRPGGNELYGNFSLQGTMVPAFPIGAVCSSEFGTGNTSCIGGDLTDGERVSSGENGDNGSNFVLINKARANDIGGVRVHPIQNSSSLDEYVVEAARSTNLPAPPAAQVYDNG